MLDDLEAQLLEPLVEPRRLVPKTRCLHVGEIEILRLGADILSDPVSFAQEVAEFAGQGEHALLDVVPLLELKSELLEKTPQPVGHLALFGAQGSNLELVFVEGLRKILVERLDLDQLVVNTVPAALQAVETLPEFDNVFLERGQLAPSCDQARLPRSATHAKDSSVKEIAALIDARRRGLRSLFDPIFDEDVLLTEQDLAEKRLLQRIESGRTLDTIGQRRCRPRYGPHAVCCSDQIILNQDRRSAQVLLLEEGEHLARLDPRFDDHGFGQIAQNHFERPGKREVDIEHLAQDTVDKRKRIPFSTRFVEDGARARLHTLAARHE